MKPGDGKGFTLIETLVALVVAATVASVVLSMVHGLYRRAQQSRAQTERIVALINDSVMVRASRWQDGALVQESDGWRLLAARGNTPPLLVDNVELSGTQPPPLGVAHTPYQRFGLRREERTLWFIAPALPPPAGVAQAAVPEAPPKPANLPGTR